MSNKTSKGSQEQIVNEVEAVIDTVIIPEVPKDVVIYANQATPQELKQVIEHKPLPANFDEIKLEQMVVVQKDNYTAVMSKQWAIYRGYEIIGVSAE